MKSVALHDVPSNFEHAHAKIGAEKNIKLDASHLLKENIYFHISFIK